VGQSPTIQKILNSGLNGTAINLADGRVEVRLEGEKERIIEFYEELKKAKPELAGNPGFYDLEFNADLMVPDSMRSSQALMLEQLSKGIVYVAGMKESMDGMKESMDGMKEEMREGFKALPKEIAKELRDLLEGKIRK